MNRKGAVITTSTAIVGIIAATMIGAIGLSDFYSLEDDLREDTIEIVASRVSMALYSMDALEEAELSIDLEAKYFIDEEGGEVVVEYGDVEASDENFVNADIESGDSQEWCIKKSSSGTSLHPEAC